MSQRRIPKKVRKEITAYVKALRQDRLPIQRVVLFGSYAQGMQRKDSDIDLCIVSPKFTNPWKATQYLWSKRLHDDGITIEPVGFSARDFDTPSPLLEEIERTGVFIRS